MSTQYTDTTILHFGPYKGKRLADVPDQYLYNLYNSGKAFGSMKQYLEDNINAIKSNLKIK